MSESYRFMDAQSIRYEWKCSPDRPNEPILEYHDGAASRSIADKPGVKKEWYNSKTLLVLGSLLRHAPDYVSKADIEKEVWRGKHIDRTSVAQHVTRLRQLFSDKAINGRYAFIRYTSGSGYRIGANVRTGSPPGVTHNRSHPPMDTSAFKEFFGEDALLGEPGAPTGAIVLQADAIDKLVSRPAATPVPEPNHPQRALKARRWLSLGDSQAAQLLVEKFQSSAFCPPKIVLSDRYAPDALPASATFEVVMGGHAGRTETEFEKIGKDWMKIRAVDETNQPLDSGDTLYLHRALVSTLTSLLTLEENSGSLLRILPLDWGPGWLDRWNHHKPVEEYAIILRNTKILEGKRRKIEFFIIGFTEVGTLAATRYLVNQWDRFARRLHLKKRLKEDSFGDFLVLLVGTSNQYAQSEEDWKIALEITPEKMKEVFSQKLAEFKCPWVERMLRAKAANGTRKAASDKGATSPL